MLDSGKDVVMDFIVSSEVSLLGSNGQFETHSHTEGPG